MIGADRARRAHQVGHGARHRSELAVRLVSAVVLAPLAVGAAAIGGWPFELFCALAAIGIWWEWATLSAGGAARMVTAIGAGALAAASVFIAAGWIGTTLACLAGGAVLVGALARSNRPAWIGAGVAYAGTMLVAPVLLRSDPRYGFLAIVFLFAVVWTTDILAYFAGRAIGGAKLAPQLSPKKTWSGAIGGAGGAVIAATAVAALAGLGQWTTMALVGLGLSIASQAGDLFESALKRCYGAKDASRLIPGHGGLMDRLDGFIAAALVAAILGLLRGGPDAPARGLLVW
ncbi:MAG TPA: phosphatidate cytidylyltransferase [Xanthobacteraceae bacterium]|nr:phosphatidate cytidylyltransferase [Xanthobacteraceae bacterium]